MRNKFCLRFLKSLTYPSCSFFTFKESVDKSGFIEKSGVYESEDALYLISESEVGMGVPVGLIVMAFNP